MHCSPRVKILSIILIALLISANYIASHFIATNRSAEFDAAELGLPYIARSNPGIIYSEITQIVSSPQYLYILYDKCGLVQMCDLDGNHIASISLYIHPNGRFQISVQGDMLYVKDRVSNLYTFQNGDFVSYAEYENCCEITREMDFDQESDEYRLKLTSVWRVEDGEDVCVISRPFWFIFFYRKVSWFLSVALVLIAGLLIQNLVRNQ